MFKKSQVLYILIFLSIVFIIGSLLYNYYKNLDYKNEIYFVVDKVEESPSLRCYYYDKNGRELSLSSHTFYAPTDIVKGDVIIKKANSKKLIIYRNDSIRGKISFTIDF